MSICDLEIDPQIHLSKASELVKIDVAARNVSQPSTGGRQGRIRCTRRKINYAKNSSHVWIERCNDSNFVAILNRIETYLNFGI